MIASPGKIESQALSVDVGARAVQHPAPRGLRRLRAEPEEAERRLAEDRGREVDVVTSTISGAKMFGRTMADASRAAPDAPSARADSMYGSPITSSTAPRTTRANAGVIDDSDRDHRVACGSARAGRRSRSRARGRGSANMMSTSRIRIESTAAPVEPREQAEERARDERDPDGDDADLQRDLRPVDDPGEGVASELVRSHRIRPARREQALVGLGVRVDVPQYGPNKATSTMKPTMPAPTSPIGFRHLPRKASRLRRGGAPHGSERPTVVIRSRSADRGSRRAGRRSG